MNRWMDGWLYISVWGSPFFVWLFPPFYSLIFNVLLVSTERVIYLGWMVDVLRQQRQLAELAVVNATVELLVQQPEVLVGTTNDPRFAIARDLQSH